MVDMKGEFTLRILEAIGGAAARIEDICEVLLQVNTVMGRQNPHNVMRMIKRRKEPGRERRKKERNGFFRMQTRFRNIAHWLKKDGIIKEQTINGGKFLMITRKGWGYLDKLKEKRRNALPPADYAVNKSKRLMVVSFDIPEKEKRKRQWLRTTLRDMGFRMKQKSLWIGHIQIPKKFIEDMRKLNIVNYVEIFEVTKMGSLRG